MPPSSAGPDRLAARPSPSGRAPPPLADGSVLSLLTANIIALIVAMLEGWDLGSLMAIYWAQSIVIGISYVLRILHLERFSTQNFTINDRPVDPTPETKRKVAGFFVVHFGAFHAAYLVFLAGQGAGAVLGDWDPGSASGCSPRITRGPIATTSSSTGKAHPTSGPCFYYGKVCLRMR